MPILTLAIWGTLVVTDGPCLCVDTPWALGWVDCDLCVPGEGIVLAAQPAWTPNTCFRGPGVPYGWGEPGWQSDMDRDGDVDLRDVAIWTARWPAWWEWP